MAFIRHLTLGLGILGCLFFSLAFVASLVKPGFVERIAKTIIRYQVEKEVNEKIEAIDAYLVKKKPRSLPHRQKSISLRQLALAALSGI